MTIVDVKREESGQYSVTLRMTKVEALQLAQQIVQAEEQAPPTTEDPPPGGDQEAEDRIA